MRNIQSMTNGCWGTWLLLAGAAVVAAVSMPSVASASVVGADGAIAGGSAEIAGSQDTQVIIDDTPSALLRTTEKVGGGVWIYGTGGGNSYSYYDHKTKTHSSTACAGFGTSCKGSGWVAKEKRSVAKVLKTAWGNTAFWNTK
jgi:lactococcin 972 family bacteriocin